MINIHKQLWVVRAPNRPVEDSDQLLAYMTHREYTKQGEPTQSFLKRSATGTTWADPRGWGNQEGIYIPDILEFDNLPAEGFKIVGSVSRWSTANKLICVEDPRGFVVEIPTGNLTTLLKHTTITKSVVQEACVWGREGSNHILLPVNSDIYQKAQADTVQNSEKVSLTKLKAGQLVKFSVDDDDEYVYLGRGKAVWKVRAKQAVRRKNNWSSDYYAANSDPYTGEECEVVDTKLCFLFRLKEPIPESEYGNYRNYEYKSSGKVVVTGEAEQVPSVDTETMLIDLPNRVKPAWFLYSCNCSYTEGKYHEAEVCRVEMKV